jgi:hypothetical protein
VRRAALPCPNLFAGVTDAMFKNSFRDELWFGRTEGGGQPIMHVTDEFGNSVSYAIDSPTQCKEIIKQLETFLQEK